MNFKKSSYTSCKWGHASSRWGSSSSGSTCYCFLLSKQYDEWFEGLLLFENVRYMFLVIIIIASASTLSFSKCYCASTSSKTSINSIRVSLFLSLNSLSSTSFLKSALKFTIRWQYCNFNLKTLPHLSGSMSKTIHYNKSFLPLKLDLTALEIL